jgi:tryptophan 2,3-dioxygenase
VTLPLEPSPEVQKILIDIYRKNPTVASIAERLVDLDEGFMEWRYRHVRWFRGPSAQKWGLGGRLVRST